MDHDRCLANGGNNDNDNLFALGAKFNREVKRDRNVASMMYTPNGEHWDRPRPRE